MLQTAFFHEDSQSVRFWVHVQGQAVGASIRRETLHYRFRPDATGEDPLETYRTYTIPIDEAVRRRVALGSIEPVMLREFDLREAIA